MKIRLLIISILYAFSFLVEAASADSAVLGPYQIRGLKIQARILSHGASLEEELGRLKELFSKLYEPYTPKALYGEDITEKLGGTSVAKSNAMNHSVQTDKDLLGKPGISHVRLETVEGRFVGYLSIKDCDIDISEKSEDIPEKSIYIRRFYILPDFQKKGLGAFAMSDLLRILKPEAKHVYLSTLRINKSAIALYEKLGFSERTEDLFGLPKENYVSYELHLGS